MTSLIMFCIVCSLYSQNNNLYGFYYANGIRHYWQEDHTSLNIIVRNLRSGGFAIRQP